MGGFRFGQKIVKKHLFHIFAITFLRIFDLISMGFFNLSVLFNITYFIYSTQFFGPEHHLNAPEED